MKKHILNQLLLAFFAISFMGCLSGFAQHRALNNAEKFEKQELVINDFPAKGLILDIGGGGAGVIGQLKGDQVISIDPLKQELIDAPSTNLKIVMDGRNLKFLDKSFNTVAIFYTLMYIQGDDHPKIFQEAKRVLKHGGRLLIWDVNLPASKDRSKKEGIYTFKFILPNTVINTGYGVPFPKRTEQNLQYYIELAKREGFKVINSSINAPSFYLELKIPSPIADTLSQIINKDGIEVAIKSYEGLKKNKSNEYYFGADVLIDLTKQLFSEDRIIESTKMFQLASKEYNLDENFINTYGYQLLSKKRNKEAIEVFTKYTEKYPSSPNSYDSLAEAYMNDGQNELAIKYYQKSLELNPKNLNAAEMLSKLKK